EIVKATSQVMLLVTSREQLNVQVEDIFLLQGLPHPQAVNDPEPTRYDAIRLFVDRARRIDKTFGLFPETLPHVIQICLLVEGLPLALELAATWVRDASVAQIAASLENNFDVLETDLRDIAPRHRNIAAVFEHSWTLLTAEEREVLSQLAVFRGGFTLSAVRSVTSTSPLTLTRLRYKSLIRGNSDGRYTMHELLRQLAWRKLNDKPDRATHAQTQHCHYFLALLKREGLHLKGALAAQAGASLRLEIDNIRQAWRWAIETDDIEQLRQCATELTTFFAYEGLGFEAVQLLQQAIDLPSLQEESKTDLLALLHIQQLSISLKTKHIGEMQRVYEQTLTLIQQNPAVSHLEAELYLMWSKSALDYGGTSKQARCYLQQAFVLLKELSNPELEARLYCQDARIYYTNGKFEAAISILTKALKIFESLGDIPGQALIYYNLAPAYAESYQLGPGLNCDRQALSLYQQLNDQVGVADAHYGVADSSLLVGAYEQARIHALKGLEIYRRQGQKIREANMLGIYAVIKDRLGDKEVAEKLHQTAIADQKALKANFSLRFSLIHWAVFQYEQGWLAEAELTLDEALAFNRDQPHARLTVQTKQALVYLAQGKSEQAQRLVNTVWQAIEPTGGKHLPFPIDTMYECYTIFQSCGDDQAQTALQMAADILKRTAAGIDDPEMRTCFLNNIEVNNKVQEALKH
ncbi:MAG: hypothetical protein AAF629_31105, partial [Chloroflexota bacterium]